MRGRIFIISIILEHFNDLMSQIQSCFDHLPNLQLYLKIRTEIDDVFSPDFNIHGLVVKGIIIHVKASSKISVETRANAI